MSVKLTVELPLSAVVSIRDGGDRSAIAEAIVAATKAVTDALGPPQAVKRKLSDKTLSTPKPAKAIKAETPKNIRVSVKDLDGAVHAFCVPPSIRVAQIKDQMAEIVGRPASGMRFIWAGKQMGDDKSLQEVCGILG